jgi:hypothetical protein
MICLDLLGCHDVFGIAGSWLGLEVCDIKVYRITQKEEVKLQNMGEIRED